MVYKFKTTQQRSQIMKKIRSVDTLPEIFFRKALWAEGIRYRKNSRKLPGKPDICISKYKVIIFIDGEFWHGYHREQKRTRIKANRKYWIPKIERNIERDKKNNRLLRKEGWKVLRFWEHKIKEDPDRCLKRALKAIKERNPQW